MTENQQISTNLKQAPFWVLLDQGAGRVVRIGAAIILARILFPEDFGIYALSLSLLELARLTGNFGIGTAIIQSSDDANTFSNSAFWVNMSASLFMFVNSFILGFVGAKFLHSPKLLFTVPVLGLTFISAGITHINYSLLIRSLEFKTVAKASVSKLTVESIVSIIFAVSGFGFWSFIYGYVLGDIVHAVLIWIWTSWRPSMKPSFRYPRKYWSFGSHIFLFWLSTYLLEHLPNMIVGRIATVYILGLFSFAWRQSRWTGDIPKLVGQNFLFPAFSRLQYDSNDFGKLYERWLRFMLVWGAPIFILQFALAPIYVPFIFGDKWIPSIAALQMLVILAFTEVTFYVPHSEALTARGKVQANAYWRILESIAVAIVLFFVASFGSAAIATGIMLVRVGLLPAYLMTTRLKLEIQFRNFVKNVFPTMLMAISGWVLWPLLFKFWPNNNFIFYLCFHYKFNNLGSTRSSIRT
jgi:O-antigen/teichoic acid export membrane protein